MKIPISPELIKKSAAWAFEKFKFLVKLLFSKKVLQGSVLLFVAFFSWKYTDFFKVSDECYKAHPTFTTALSIKNPNMRWEEFNGLEMRGLVKTFADDGKQEIVHSYDLLTGKSAEAAKSFLLKGFINSYDTKVKGCVESVTMFTKIQTLSGSKALLNESRNEVRLEKKFLSSEKEKANPKKTRSIKCKVELTINPIDPLAQTVQVPSGNIKMSCG